MADRLAALKRIQGVQTQMARLAEWRIAAADRACRVLADDQARLREYVSTDGSIGVALAKAALKSIIEVDRRLVRAQTDRACENAKLVELKRGERVVTTMHDEAAVKARRADEDRDLARTLDAWLARDQLKR